MFSKLLKREIIYQLHAAHRSIERDISPGRILEIIDDPASAVTIQKNHRIKFCNNSEVVIAELKGNSLWIITAYRK
ncbi:MAG TPA: hypothetical protein PK466_06415 [Thermotogota bacterium]|nr:hypothetical protein [Thermotogota bacterium]HPJ88706.1 hypothetical protein [Thermotogota bacterium]HPR95945.1 hypothetical protein [Thermotogota bacterium]